MNAYLAQQFSGPVVQAVVGGLEQSFDDTAALLAYWTSLSIATASDVDGSLNYIGSLAGFPRPMVSYVFTVTNLLQFFDANLAMGASNFGLDDANTPGVAGQFDNASPLSSALMPASWYQSMLVPWAQVKYSGLTLRNVDVVAAWGNTVGGGTGYTIAWSSYGSVRVTYKTAIDIRALWVVNLIFSTAQTLPLVVAQQP
jgi:hypothetical protein